MLLIIVSNTFYSYGESLTGAFLPELARPAALGKVSGWGWGFGYFGGMLALGLCLGYVLWAQGQGMPADAFRAGHDADHGVLYGAAAWSPSGCCGERAQPNPQALRQSGLKASLQQLQRTFREARRLPDFMWLLALRGVLPGRRGGGDHAGGDLRRDR